MWIPKSVWVGYEHTRIADAQRIEALVREAGAAGQLQVSYLTQKAKDDITIDWMRHRVNALEKQNAVLMQKATGVAMPIPEIVPTRPGTLSQTPMMLPNLNELPSFEDVGDNEAARLGIMHDEDGTAVYTT